MLHTTSGIILHTIKYSESSLIVKMYTRDFGLRSYMVSGVRSKKSKSSAKLFQPLALVEVVVSNTNYVEIPYNIVKSSIAIFLNEVLNKSLSEEHADAELFDYIKNALLVLDLTHHNCANFHVFFMVQLSRQLGFFPQGKYTAEASIFDLREGRFVNQLPDHFYYLSSKNSKLLYDLILCSYENIQDLKINQAERKELLHAMVLFYQLHIASFKEIRSMEILEEVIS